MTTAPPALDNPFWRFSREISARDGVVDALMSLRDRFGIDVNLALFALWLGAERGYALDGRCLEMAEKSVIAWHADIVQPLRGACRALRTGLSHFPEARMLGSEMHNLEAWSDRIEQAALAELARHWPEGRPSPALASSNLQLLLGRCDARVARARLTPIFDAISSPAASAPVP